MKAHPGQGRRRPTRTLWQKGRALGFIVVMHLVALTLCITGTTWRAFAGFLLFYVVTIFALGPILHRYFGHRAFRTSRWFQFLLACFAGVVFADVIGFAGKHRLHHRFSDTDLDVHSPRQGLWFCWIGSLLDEGYADEEILRAVPDLTMYPELLWLHRYFYLPGIATATAMLLAFGFVPFVTVYCLNFLVAVHAPSAVNYFCHRGGRRNFETADASTNRVVLGYLLLGEGWHNNHHRFPGSASLGIRRFEFDAGYQLLKLLAATGLIWALREPEGAVQA